MKNKKNRYIFQRNLARNLLVPYKQNKKVLYRAGAKLTVDRTKIEGEKSPQLYLHVKGTKNYLYWGNEKDYGASPLDYRHGSTNLILQTLLHN